VFILKKKSSPELVGQFQSNLVQSRIRNCSKEGSGSFPWGDNHRNAKIG
jgi:hypothetical protein